MYRLTLYGLLILAAYALGLAFVGMLNFNPLAMIINLIVLIVVGYGINAAFAWLLHVRTNPESTFITSLLLFFLLSPPLEGQNYLPAVVAAALASASKYVLAWRRRHIFNPAALAVVICAVFGMAHVSWWVGTWQMFPLIVLIGSVIAYKVGQVQLAVVYTVASWMIVGILFLTGQTVTWQFIAIIIFIALFLITDPLTQPPRQRQRFVYAACIAVLGCLSFEFFGVAMTPEGALLVGNIFAFLCGQRRGIFMKLESRTPLPDGQVRYKLQPRSKLSFVRGQYIELQVPHVDADANGTRRFYKLMSYPDSDELSIVLEHAKPASSFEKALQHLPIHSTLTATGIYDAPPRIR